MPLMRNRFGQLKTKVVEGVAELGGVRLQWLASLPPPIIGVKTMIKDATYQSTRLAPTSTFTAGRINDPNLG